MDAYERIARTLLGRMTPRLPEDAHPVAVLGATGAVGQTFIRLLADHPWFELAELAASERSAGKKYARSGALDRRSAMPATVRDMTVLPCDPPRSRRHRVLGARRVRGRRGRDGVRASRARSC